MSDTQIVSFIDACVEDQPLATQMLEEDPELLTMRYIWGGTALHFLVIEGFQTGVEFLLSHSADPNLINEMTNTPLMDAAILERVEMIQLLVEHGADLDTQNDEGQTALHLAIDANCHQAAQCLLKLGAKADIPNEYGETAADLLAKSP